MSAGNKSFSYLLTLSLICIALAFSMGLSGCSKVTETGESNVTTPEPVATTGTVSGGVNVPAPETGATSSTAVLEGEPLTIEAVDVKVEGNNLVCTVKASRADAQYAFYVMHGNNVLTKQAYQVSPTYQYPISEPGDYWVQAYAMVGPVRVVKDSNKVTYTPGESPKP